MIQKKKSDLKCEVPKVTKVNVFYLYLIKKDKAGGCSLTLAHFSSL
jgi:hypothetical protein